MVLSAGSLKVSWLLKRTPRLSLHKVSDPSDHFEKVRDSIKNREIGVYVHVPYCRSICMFCPYFRAVLRGSEEIEHYFKALYREVELYGKLLSEKGLKIVEIHVGGGTPSLVPGKYYSTLLEKLSEFFDVKSGIGVEANPEDFKDRKVVEELYASGVDEVSIGVQSFNQKVLKALGRKHTPKDNIAAIENSVRTGFKWINADIMFLAPSIKNYVEVSDEEGLNTFTKDLEKSIDLGVHQVTYYPTIIPEHSPGYKLVELSRLLQNEDLVDAYVEKAVNFTKERGLSMVRVYSLSRKKYEYATVNLEMVGPLIGFGAGAWSNTGYYQYVNVHNLPLYVRAVNEGRLPALYSRVLSESSRVWRLFFDQLSACSLSREAYGFIGLRDIPWNIKILLKLMSITGITEKKGDNYVLTLKGIKEVYKSVVNYVTEIPVKATKVFEDIRDPAKAPEVITI